MIGLKDVQKLHSLRPDQGKLLEISKRTRTSGFYPFTLHPDADVQIHSRLFCPALGIAEDPVTGTAGGPVGAYIVRFGLLPGAGETGLKVFSVCQGEAIGRAGILQVTACVKSGTVSEVSIAGRAVIVFRTEISL